MASLEDIRRHVLDDASELAATTGMVQPLLEDGDLAQLSESKFKTINFLRRLLLQQAALVVVRLHEKPSSGATGETASIASLLSHAAAEGLMSSDEVVEFHAKLASLQNELGSKGFLFSELRRFRHAEIAHSLHVANRPTLPLGPIWDFAHDTFELIIEIDERLTRACSTLPPLNLDREFDKWRDRGAGFWDLPDGD